MIELIAESIRRHFILDPLRGGKFISDDNYEDSSMMSLVLFVGLCRQYGISETEIMVYAGLEEMEYDSKVLRFNETMDLITERISKGSLSIEKDYADRFYSKYRMLLRYISTQASFTKGKDLYMWRKLLK